MTLGGAERADGVVTSSEDPPSALEAAGSLSAVERSRALELVRGMLFDVARLRLQLLHGDV